MAEKNMVCSQLSTSAMRKDVKCGYLTFLTNYCIFCCHPSFHSPVAQPNSTLYNSDKSGSRTQLPSLPRIPNLWLNFNSDHFWTALFLELASEFSSPSGDHVLKQLKIPDLDSSLIPPLDIHLQRTPSSMIAPVHKAVLTLSHFGISQTSSERDNCCWHILVQFWFYCFWDLGWNKEIFMKTWCTIIFNNFSTSTLRPPSELVYFAWFTKYSGFLM